MEPNGEAKGATWEAKETQMRARGASLEHARTMLFTVREAHGQFLGEVRGPTFPRPRSRTLSGEVLWSPFGDFSQFGSPFGILEGALGILGEPLGVPGAMGAQQVHNSPKTL